MKKYYLLLLTALIISVISCSEDSAKQDDVSVSAPNLSTQITVSSIINRTVTLSASVSSDEISIYNYGFCYYTSPDVDIDNGFVAKSSNKDSEGAYSYDLSIDDNVDYYIRAYAKYKDQVWYSEEYHLSTTLNTYVSTEPVNIRARVGAIGQGTLLGQRSIYDSWGFCIDTEDNPTVDDTKYEASQADNAVSEDGEFGVFFDELTAETTYYVRSYAITDGEVHYGNQVAFTTTSGATITYNIIKEPEPTADQADAYEKIEACIDSAIYYFHRYCNKVKTLSITYNVDVPTADANSVGNMRFGKNRSYMWVGTAMHEINHTFGSGTSPSRWALYDADTKRYLGENANVVIRVFLEDYTKAIYGDYTHFWPGGINYSSEVTSDKVLKMNAMIMEGMIMDGLTQ